MSISLPNNKKEKWLRLSMLAKQGSITWPRALLLYIQYCRLYERVNK